MTPPYSPARFVATRVLHRVATEGAWASRTLDVEIDEVRLDDRDAALATTITYGTLRVLPRLDRAIDAQLKQKGSLDPFTRAALRAAAYQLGHLRTPPHAVVSDTVSIVRAKRGDGLSRFANAVLRKLAQLRPETPSEPTSIDVPDWLTSELEASLGQERTQEFLVTRTLPPAVSLRAHSDRERLAQRIREQQPGATVSLSSLSPLGLYVSRAGDPRELWGYRDGLFAVQDEGSQLVALLAEGGPDLSIADVCSGRGGKTTLLAAEMNGSGRLAAIDMYDNKLDKIAREFGRVHISERILETHAIDMAVGTGGLESSFDRVLVDAPCTGLGTIHRRPEILLRTGARDPSRMAELQLAVLSNAARLVAPGGLLIYAVCSPVRAEGVAVAAALEEKDRSFERVVRACAGLEPDPDGVFRIGPFGIARDNGPDCYQAIRWRKAMS